MRNNNKIVTKKGIALHYHGEEIDQVQEYTQKEGLKQGRFAVIAMLEKIERDSVKEEKDA